MQDINIKNLLSDPIKYVEKLSTGKLVDLLKILSYKYFKTEGQLVPDDTYDILLDYLKLTDPNNEYLSNIGYKDKDDVKLPYFMPSLNKIKPEKMKDEKSMEKWKLKYSGPYVISDKLDGESGMIIKKGKLVDFYTRGDGEYGKKKSYILKYIEDGNYLERLKNIKCDFVIRGELIMSKENYNKIKNIYKTSRAAVVGMLSKKRSEMDKMSEYLNLIKFVPYSLIDTKDNKSTGLEIISEKLCLKPVHYEVFEKITSNILIKHLKIRKNESEYDIDGIVIDDNNENYILTNKNPDNAFAFKIISKENVAKTEVVDVKWEISKDHYFVPVALVRPVTIEGKTIKKVTLKNFRYVKEKEIGPGSEILITFSGDVIPEILEVLKKSEIKYPIYPFVLNKSGVDIMLDVSKLDEEKFCEEVNSKSLELDNLDSNIRKIILAKRIAHFFKTIGSKNLSDSIAEKLVDKGYDNVIKILKADRDKIAQIDRLGEKSVDKIYENIFNALNESKLSSIMAACNVFKRGISKKKLEIVTENIPNILNVVPDYNDLMKLKGFSHKTTSQFLENYDDFLEFFKELEKIDGLEFSRFYESDVAAIKICKKGIFDGKKILFTGHRNGNIRNFIEENGGIIMNAFSNNINLLVYKEESNDSKYENSLKAGIDMISMAKFIEKYM